MHRTERRLFQLNDEIVALEAEVAQATEELSFHRHLHDDARRDAIVSDHPLDRADARETAADVARFEAHLAKLERKRRKLDDQRRLLLRSLGD